MTSAEWTRQRAALVREEGKLDRAVRSDGLTLAQKLVRIRTRDAKREEIRQHSLLRFELVK